MSTNRKDESVLIDPLFEQVDETIAKIDATIAAIKGKTKTFCRSQKVVCGSCFHNGNCCLKQKVGDFSESVEELVACE